MKATPDLYVAIQDYFDGIHFGDTGRLRRVLHSDIRLVCRRDNLNIGREEYLDIVDSRPSPDARGDSRHDAVLSIGSHTPTTAHATVNLAYLPKVFTDELVLIFEDGRWQVISKVWDYELSETEQGASN